MDCSPPGLSVRGILQTRILEWVAIPSSRGSSQPRDWTKDSGIAGRFFTVRATRQAHTTFFPSHNISSSGLDGEADICNFIIGKEGVFLSVSRMNTSKTKWSANVHFSSTTSFHPPSGSFGNFLTGLVYCWEQHQAQAGNTIASVFQAFVAFKQCHTILIQVANDIFWKAAVLDTESSHH